MKEFCTSHLIKQQVSDPYIPQQNGLAERFNRTILESMRTILEDSEVNKQFWNKIAKVSSLTLNQIPAHGSKKSPFELFKGRTLPLDYFRPTGNKVSYVILPERSFSKLQPKDSNSSKEEVTISLIPNSELPPTQDPIPELTRVLRERNTQVKPIKYTHLTTDPKSFKAAMNSNEKNGWKTAADKELANIEHHQVWEEVDEVPASFLLTMWVFKTKPATLSASERKKARLCIQGFSQIEGVDYDKTSAPTGKFTTLLVVLMLAIDKKLLIWQFDVKSAFLYAPLKEEIFIKTPEGSTRSGPYLRLKKSLYVLKQALANWYDTLTGWFEDINFHQSTSGPCLFIHNDHTSIIFFHIDDLVVVGNVEAFEALFLNRFPNSTAHDPDTLLGMDVNIENNLIALSQEKLIDKGLDMLGLSDCKPVATPLLVGVQLLKATKEEEKEFKKLNLNY
ncbi:hypothetical protein PCASD_24627 [Puccinia coronata f. sp. avenae]|uniref:Integrase catalytic domain-containing protein n=1 Tax=Puccinia coronata f. sp. avenae TaxID=200324 RepID=A0A2N5TI94_9BASI|nr:hypothetical protein PCASD_24627 [Puccinia coronata f. sp. avenae]